MSNTLAFGYVVGSEMKFHLTEAGKNQMAHGAGKFVSWRHNNLIFPASL